MFQFV
ncbi:hypothetical protein BpHYR1_018331 [Brachionus plicatilis]